MPVAKMQASAPDRGWGTAVGHERSDGLQVESSLGHGQGPHLLTDSGSFPFSDEKNNPPQEGTHVTKISLINALQCQRY